MHPKVFPKLASQLSKKWVFLFYLFALGSQADSNYWYTGSRGFRGKLKLVLGLDNGGGI